MTLSDALRAATARLKAAGIEAASRDARILLAHAEGINPDRLTLHLPEALSPSGAARLEAFVTARIRRQPVSQIIGHRLFCGLAFHVTPDVLDPRPETEVLVQAALSRPFARMLDLGTGSGCVLLSCLHARPEATGIGTDLSTAALAVARDNAQALGLSGRAEFQTADWFHGLSGQYDLITSNPPYIAEAEMPGLSTEVRAWEPHLALTPGGDGLAAYRAIAAAAPAHLAPGGRIILEIGPTQAAAVLALLGQAGLTGLAVLPDLDQRDRVVLAEMPR